MSFRSAFALAFLTCLLGGRSAFSESPVLALTGVNLVTEDGKVIKGATIVIKGGVISAAGPEVKAPRGAKVQDLRGAYVLPGLVAADTALVLQEGEDAPSIYPEKVAFDGFRLYADWRRQFEDGTTCAYLCPGKARLVSGRGSVVRLGVEDPHSALLRREAALETVLTDSSLNPPGLFKPEVYPRPSKPFPHVERQLPTARASQIAELKKFLESSHPIAQAVRRGELPLRIRADTPRQIREALRLARSLRLHPTIVGAAQAGALAGDLRRSKAQVVWLCPFDPERAVARDPVRFGPDPFRFLETPGLLAGAGVPVAIATTRGDGRSLLAAAAFAVSHGMPKEKALRAITVEAARILGVSDKVGVVAPGRPADLVVLNGPPFAAGARVIRTFVAGRVVYEGRRPPAGRSGGDLLLRGALVLTGDGGRFPGTDILIRDGRIAAVEAGLKAPEGVKVIDLEGKVVAPGMIDLASRLGTHVLGEDSTQAPSFRGGDTFLLSVGSILRPEDPAFSPCLREGVLGLVVRGASGSVVSGTGAFVLPGRRAPDFVELPFACIDIDVSGPSRFARLNSLRSLLRRLESYRQAWKRYREALKEYQHRKPRDTENKLKEPAPPSADPVMDRLLEARKRAIPLFVRAERGDAIQGALKLLADEGGYECALVGASGIQHVENVARMCRGVILTPPYFRKVEGQWVDLPKLLAGRDIPFALASGGAEGSYYLRYYVSEAVRRGLSPDRALRAVTSVPARLLGVSDKFGVIARGRIADLVVYDGEVFAPGTRVVMVFVEGRRVYGGR